MGTSRANHSSTAFGAGDSGLVDAHETERLSAYLQDLWRRRSYITYESASTLRSRQSNTVLGSAWHLLNPALSIAIYYLIFGRLLKTDRGVDNFILFLTVGVFAFQYTQRSTITGAQSIISNVGLLKSIRFPRAMLPVTTIVTETMTSLPSFGLVYAVALVFGETPRWEWLLFPLVIGIQMLFNLGAAFISARMTTHFRDTAQLLPFLFRLLFYASGVIFSVKAYATGRYAWVFTLNPMYAFISLSRWCIMGEGIEGEVVVSAATWTVLILVVGFLWFRSAEDTYGRV